MINKLRKEPNVFSCLFKTVRKSAQGMCDETSNSHHDVFLLPECCVPKGMKKYTGGKVVIKNKMTQDLRLENIERDLDILEEQMELAIQEIYSLKDQSNKLLETLIKNSPYGEEIFLPDFDCTLGELKSLQSAREDVKEGRVSSVEDFKNRLSARKNNTEE